MSSDRPHPPPHPGRAHLHSVPEPEQSDQQRVHLGAQLRVARQAKNLTQEQAAAVAGLTRNAIANLEKSAFPDPKLSTLLRLMRAYDLGSIEHLLGPVPSNELGKVWAAQDWQPAPAAQPRL